MTDPNHIAEARKKVSRPQIREVFLRNGAVFPADRDDLPDYVYESVFELLEMAATAVQGEPVAWSGWGCQYPGKMPRLYGDRRIAELNCDWGNGDQVLYFTAAPQPAEQQPAPDVAGLVEALEYISKKSQDALEMTDNRAGRAKDEILYGYAEHIIQSCDAALAAHRSKGGE